MSAAPHWDQVLLRSALHLGSTRSLWGPGSPREVSSNLRSILQRRCWKPRECWLPLCLQKRRKPKERGSWGPPAFNLKMEKLMNESFHVVSCWWCDGMTFCFSCFKSLCYTEGAVLPLSCPVCSWPWRFGRIVCPWLTYCLRPGGCTAETPLRSEGKIQKGIRHHDYISRLAGSWGGWHRRVPFRLQTQRNRIRRKNLGGEEEEHFPWYFQPKSLV